MQVDLDGRALLDDAGKPIKLRRRSLNLLLLLAQHPGRTVQKEKLISENWPRVTATDESLSRCVSDIRQALGPAYRHNLKTVAGLGYMLTGDLYQSRNYLQLTEVGGQSPHQRTAEKPTLCIRFEDRTLNSTHLAAAWPRFSHDILVYLGSCRWIDTIEAKRQKNTAKNLFDSTEGSQAIDANYAFELTLWDNHQLSAKLFDLATNKHIWSNHFALNDPQESGLDAAFARRLVSFIDPILRASEISKAEGLPPAKRGGYAQYLCAYTQLSLYTREGFLNAEKMLRIVVRDYPLFAEAIALLADCVGRLALSGWKEDAKAAFDEAYSLAERAINISPNQPHILAIAAWTCATFSEKYERACELSVRAIACHPITPDVYSCCGWAYLFAGELEGSLRLFDNAQKLYALDSRNHLFLLGIAGANYFLGNFSITISLTRRILKDMPRNVVAQRILLAALALNDQKEAAAQALSDMMQLHPGYTLSIARLSVMNHDWMMDMWIDGLKRGGVPE